MIAVLHRRKGKINKYMAFKKTFVLSDEGVNSYGFVVKTSGIRLDNARNNCPAFYDHKTWEIPLGHWENLRVENSRLMGDLIIEGANDLEKSYITKIQNGDIKGASIGADPLIWNNDAFQLKQGQTRPTLDECELFEVSITPLPGNTNSLCLKRKDGVVTLNADNVNLHIPLLNKNADMKAIALKLGLAETATENEILTAIGAVQLARKNAEDFTANILTEAQKDLSEDLKGIFVELSKTSPTQALKLVQLNKVVTTTNVTNPPVAGNTKKEVKVTDLIQVGRQHANGTAVEKNEDSFDYLQRHNKIELARIQKEEPEKYAALTKDYANGVRYKA